MTRTATLPNMIRKNSCRYRQKYYNIYSKYLQVSFSILPKNKVIYPQTPVFKLFLKYNQSDIINYILLCFLTVYDLKSRKKFVKITR